MESRSLFDWGQVSVAYADGEPVVHDPDTEQRIASSDVVLGPPRLVGFSEMKAFAKREPRSGYAIDRRPDGSTGWTLMPFQGSTAPRLGTPARMKLATLGKANWPCVGEVNAPP